jgi:hypothetical protein
MRMGLWSELIHAITVTSIFLKKKKTHHWGFAIAMSSLSWVKSSPSLPFIHVNFGPKKRSEKIRFNCLSVLSFFFFKKKKNKNSLG